VQEYDRPDGEAWFFIGGVLAMLAPALMASIGYFVVEGLRQGDWHWIWLVLGIFYPVWFPFYNLYVAVQDIRGKQFIIIIIIYICQAQHLIRRNARLSGQSWLKS
jgi:hypothetical protein